MAIGTQEIITILIVVTIVGFALYRRLRKKNSTPKACSGCEQNTANNSNEKPVRFFKKQR
jgi:hypothetical protein